LSGERTERFPRDGHAPAPFVAGHDRGAPGEERIGDERVTVDGGSLPGAEERTRTGMAVPGDDSVNPDVAVRAVEPSIKVRYTQLSNHRGAVMTAAIQLQRSSCPDEHDRELGSRANVQLAVDLGEIPFDGLWPHQKSLRDLVIRSAIGD
jgi:hypothetical protein